MYIANLETTIIFKHRFILLVQVKLVLLEVEGLGKLKQEKGVKITVSISWKYIYLMVERVTIQII